MSLLKSVFLRFEPGHEFKRFTATKVVKYCTYQYKYIHKKKEEEEEAEV